MLYSIIRCSQIAANFLIFNMCCSNGIGMHTLKFRPYHLLLLASVCTILGSIVMRNIQLNVIFYDSFVVFSNLFLLNSFAAVLFLLWIIYQSTQRLPYLQELTWIHVAGTILITAMLLTTVWFQSTAISHHPPGVGLRATSGDDIAEAGELYTGERLLSMAVVGLLILQLCYIINLWIAINWRRAVIRR